MFFDQLASWAKGILTRKKNNPMEHIIIAVENAVEMNFLLASFIFAVFMVFSPVVK